MKTLNNPANRTRKFQVKVILNEKEYKHFIKQVDKTPYTKYTYLRRLIGGNEIHTRQPEEYFEVRRLVSKMSNNINQIARIANIYGDVDQGQVQVLLQMMNNAFSPSMSRTGNPYDNAVMENFFGSLKTECLYRTSLRNFDEAEEIVDKYVDFYNYRRLKLKTSMTPYEKTVHGSVI